MSVCLFVAGLSKCYGYRVFLKMLHTVTRGGLSILHGAHNGLLEVRMYVCVCVCIHIYIYVLCINRLFMYFYIYGLLFVPLQW
jgi:hypothetical protein